jgi:hypothetical protein
MMRVATPAESGEASVKIEVVRRPTEEKGIVAVGLAIWSSGIANGLRNPGIFVIGGFIVESGGSPLHLLGIFHERSTCRVAESKETENAIWEKGELAVAAPVGRSLSECRDPIFGSVKVMKPRPGDAGRCKSGAVDREAARLHDQREDGELLMQFLRPPQEFVR